MRDKEIKYNGIIYVATPQTACERNGTSCKGCSFIPFDDVCAKYDCSDMLDSVFKPAPVREVRKRKINKLFKDE